MLYPPFFIIHTADGKSTDTTSFLCFCYMDNAAFNLAKLRFIVAGSSARSCKP